MEEKQVKRNRFEPFGWLALGLAGGYVAFQALSRKQGKASDLFDVDSVLKSCDRAARQLDELMVEESRVRAS